MKLFHNISYSLWIGIALIVLLVAVLRKMKKRSRNNEKSIERIRGPFNSKKKRIKECIGCGKQYCMDDLVRYFEKNKEVKDMKMRDGYLLSDYCPSCLHNIRMMSDLDISL